MRSGVAGTLQLERLRRLQRLLGSAGLARAIVIFLASYIGVAAWLPWARAGRDPPAWAAALGLGRPFSSPAFLGAVALLFASTLACTWGKRSRVAATYRGGLPAGARSLAAFPGAGLEPFLRARGFRGDGPILFKNRFALWGGWVLHVGLLVLVAGVVVQQALHDSGAFELTEGERAGLSQPGVVFGRERGLFAPERPPEIEVSLDEFDPFLRQGGYAPDRLSRLTLREVDGPAVRATVDRARGVRAKSAVIYQAIPAGLAVNLEVAGMGVRSIRLRQEADRRASRELTDPAGRPARLVLTSERKLSDASGTGAVRVELEGRGGRTVLQPGVPFPFGDGEARLVSLGRWSGFTYSRSPGMVFILAGFSLVLAGCAVLAFPAGVAHLSPGAVNEAGRVFLSRGTGVLAAEWERAGSGAAAETDVGAEERN